MKGRVCDAVTNEPLIGASVVVKDGNVVAITDADGYFILPKSKVDGNSRILVSYIGYNKIEASLMPNHTYFLVAFNHQLKEVVVTARESEGLTSSSKIGQDAMKHLQPSSFTDILELLPGGKSKDPNLSAPNTIHLREASTPGSNYQTSALGTSFVVDGAPISNDANLQGISSSSETQVDTRDFMNKGVDMRTIATDDIENIEIIRGIPSAEYGELTSGLVKISRKKGGNNINARLKVDMNSKLFHIGKGLELYDRNLSFNLSLDYLDAKADPRNNLENYKRINTLFQLGKRWHDSYGELRLSSSIEYGVSIDNEKVDPDINFNTVDSYYSSYKRASVNNTLNFMPANNRVLKNVTALLSFSLQDDQLKRTRLVQLQRDTSAPSTMEPGVSDAVILPYTYEASHKVEGMPVTLFGKISSLINLPMIPFNNSLKLGLEYQLDKNYGKGQIFDIMSPAYPSTYSRPYSYSSIPARNLFSFYAEEDIVLPIQRSLLRLSAGLRGAMMLNLDNDYYLSNKIYIDPRINIGWKFPKFQIARLPIEVNLSGGVGEQTKMPTMSQLYPENVYMDLVQLNYYHTNPEYRRINLMTYVVNPANKGLKAARNLKWELKGDINIAHNRFSITYFRENMKSGFRSVSVYNPYEYKKYSTAGIDGDKITAPPSLDDLSYTNMSELRAYSTTMNSSRTEKEGIEFTFSTPRFDAIKTRFTMTGAWFRTTYSNSAPLMERPSVVLDGESYKYVGIYEDVEGYRNEMANTNFMIDTDIPRLGLGFSISAQCEWFSSSQTLFRSETPTKYMDNMGNIFAFTAADATDPYLKWMVKSYSPSIFEKNVIPFGMSVNFKATKSMLNNKLLIALFVNKMLDYYPNYKSNGFVIRRNVSPYFGLEMNIKI